MLVIIAFNRLCALCCSCRLLTCRLILAACVLIVPAQVFAFYSTDSVISQTAVLKKDSILSVTNLGVQKDSTRIKEIIVIKVNTYKPLDSLTTLYVDGIATVGLKPWKTNDADKTLYFRLDDQVQNTLLNFLESNPFEKSILKVYFSVGGPHSYISNNHQPLYVEVRQKISHLWIWAAAILLILLAGISLNCNILKDDNNLYYSLGRTQLFYWTVLVLIAYISICFKTDTIPDLPLSVLAILGISMSTTAVSKLVENKNKSEVPIDKSAKSEGFFFDILSDGSSINIQRFQNVAFNLFFGVIFLQKAFANHIMPDFDQNVLILMGISSGAYAGLKNTETTKDQNEPAKQTGDDIPAEPQPAPASPAAENDAPVA
jgi:hypothetical protein